MTELFGWLNIYPSKSDTLDGHAGGIYRTEADADKVAKAHRIACVKVTWQVPSKPNPPVPETFIQAMGHGKFYAYFQGRGADQDFESYEDAATWVYKCQTHGRFFR